MLFPIFPFTADTSSWIPLCPRLFGASRGFENCIESSRVRRRQIQIQFAAVKMNLASLITQSNHFSSSQCSLDHHQEDPTCSLTFLRIELGTISPSQCHGECHRRIVLCGVGRNATIRFDSNCFRRICFERYRAAAFARFRAIEYGKSTYDEMGDVTMTLAHTLICRENNRIRPAPSIDDDDAVLIRNLLPAATSFVVLDRRRRRPKKARIRFRHLFCQKHTESH